MLKHLRSVFLQLVTAQAITLRALGSLQSPQECFLIGIADGPIQRLHSKHQLGIPQEEPASSFLCVLDFLMMKKEIRDYSETELNTFQRKVVVFYIYIKFALVSTLKQHMSWQWRRACSDLSWGEGNLAATALLSRSVVKSCPQVSGRARPLKALE